MKVLRIGENFDFRASCGRFRCAPQWRPEPSWSLVVAMTTADGVAPVAGYTFGPFLLDPRRRLLWRDLRVVPLSTKTFELLLVLIEHRDRIVEKDQLMTLVWPGI